MGTKTIQGAIKMAKRNRKTDQTTIDKRIKEGRGQGIGAEYTPWLRIQDVSSNGLAHRIKGWKTKREHHFLSSLECRYFYVLEWSPHVLDIREQYPLLPLAETLAIAQECGFKHPADPRTREPIVMTTDFVVTVTESMGGIDRARTIKPSKDLSSKRVLEKLEIERCYWRARNTGWGIVTEHEIPRVLARNVELLHGYHQLTDRLSLPLERICMIANALTSEVLESNASLKAVAADCDKRLGLEPGTALTVAYHMLATKQWQVDINTPIEPRKKLIVHKVQIIYRGEGDPQ
jgi:hypothetical protein